jgi:excisionase family DNA binding protein
LPKADYLRLKERKLYELVAEGAIPCTKVTGKWLFPRGDLDRWLLAGMARPLGVVPADPPPIVGGSHDPLLQWALAESRAGLAILPEGTEAGYRRFLERRLRETFGFEGSPVRINVRVREKRGARSR